MSELHKNGVVLHFADLGLSRPEVTKKIDDSSSEVAAPEKKKGKR